ncbi:MAG: helix-turn-helix domain-containing protein [Pseudonocardiaceae bacterium]
MFPYLPRQAMEQAGLTGKQTAKMCSWSTSFVSLLLSGKHGVSEVDIATFLRVCRVKAWNGTGCSSMAPGCQNSF